MEGFFFLYAMAVCALLVGVCLLAGVSACVSWPSLQLLRELGVGWELALLHASS